MWQENPEGYVSFNPEASKLGAFFFLNSYLPVTQQDLHLHAEQENESEYEWGCSSAVGGKEEVRREEHILDYTRVEFRRQIITQSYISPTLIYIIQWPKIFIRCQIIA